MSYTVKVIYQQREAVQIGVSTIEEAREAAVDQVQISMEAFSDDPAALYQYGYTEAEEKALDMPEEGGVIKLANGEKIEIINNKE